MIELTELNPHPLYARDCASLQARLQGWLGALEMFLLRNFIY